jgi:hypothetical protein
MVCDENKPGSPEKGNAMFTAISKRVLFGLGALVLASTLVATEAKAQWGVWNPPVYGGYDMWGNGHIVYGSRLNPGAELHMPGTTGYFNNGTSWGQYWIGADGLPHSNITNYNPWTGTTTTHYRARIRR